LIENTFIHISGIGPKTERHLWDRGFRTWQDLLAHDAPVFSSQGRDGYVRGELAASVANRDNILFFGNRLSSLHAWRLFESFGDRAVYLDIETNGGWGGLEEITLIGLYDGRQVRTYVHGIDLADFEIALAAYDMVVTFNGSQFDLPAIKRRFPYVDMPPVHLDLRFMLRSLGYKGGLKAIESTLGLVRSDDIKGLQGFDAVLLWHAYENGDKEALERLIRYNTADIVHLQPLAQWGCEEMKRRLLPWSPRAPQ
jgi:uncharacterized protein